MSERIHLPTISKGYRYVYAPTSKSAVKSGSLKGYAYEHRVVMEKYLGKPLMVNDHVHHIDLNPLNNDVTNLMVLKSSDHVRLHSILKNCRKEDLPDMIPGECIKDYYLRILSSCHHRRCIDCGKELSVFDHEKSKIIRCKCCASIKNRKVARPDPDYLTSILIDSTLTSVASKYGVSANAVIKWCNRYGIDYKKLKTRVR